MKIVGPLQTVEITLYDFKRTEAISEAWLHAFLNVGRRWRNGSNRTPFASAMIGKDVEVVWQGGHREAHSVSRGIWEKVTAALVEVGLAKKAAGAQTVILFRAPLLPILIEKPTRSASS
jgi:hypothetical protein